MSALLNYKQEGQGQTVVLIHGSTIVENREERNMNLVGRMLTRNRKHHGFGDIRSNATGIITNLNLNINDYIAEGDIIASIVQPASLRVQVNIPYEYSNDIQQGTSCEVLLPNGTSLKAKISDILPIVDAVSQAQSFLIDLHDTKELPENLNVKVKFVQKESADILTIPKQAIQTNELLTKFWVMKVVNDSLALRTTVEPALKNDSLIQVKSSHLHLDNLVVTSGAYQMQDSTIVKVQK